ncbi:MAG: caspase family protein [Spirochaetota bacterium]
MPTFHAILVADLHDESIGCIHDIKNWRKELKTIKQHTGMDLKKIEIMGEDWSRDTVIETCQNLDVGSDDAVLFHYSGHGYRFESMESRWPAMALQHDEGVALGWAYKTLLEKEPRFLMAISDSCNNVIPEGAIPTRMGSFRSMRSMDLSTGYKKLFLESDAKIIASGCMPGQFSLGGPDGGAFTSRFLTYLRKDVVKGDSANWPDFLQRSCAPMQTPGNLQSPQHEIDGEVYEEEAPEDVDFQKEEVVPYDEDVEPSDWYDDDVDFDDIEDDEELCFCPECGIGMTYDILADNDDECIECGAYIPEEFDVEVICPSCGAENADSNYCFACGEEL